jgi:hypothetical protein
MTRLYRNAIVAAAPLMLIWSAGAATFESLSSTRSINIGATVGVSANDDSGFSDTRNQGDGRSLPGYGYVDQAVGLSGFGFSTPYGGGGASGRVSQQSEMNGERIYFNGFADVYASASSGFDGNANASGSAMSTFGYSFHLASPTSVRLFMSSSGADDVTSQYSFSFYNNNGSVIWDQTGIESDFRLLNTFSVDLPLNPGDYTVTSQVGASSSFEGGFGFAGQSRAEFTITPIPEPGTILLLAIGALLLWLPKRRRHKSTARPVCECLNGGRVSPVPPCGPAYDSSAPQRHPVIPPLSPFHRNPKESRILQSLVPQHKNIPDPRPIVRYRKPWTLGIGAGVNYGLSPG